jgi:hypothetical protein
MAVSNEGTRCREETSEMGLMDLPADLLVSLPHYLDSVEDLYALLRVNRALYTICNSTKAALRPKLKRRNGRHVFEPHPHMLIAGTARQVADWAVQSIENRNHLHSALLRGLEGLTELCVEVAAMPLEDIRELHRTRLEVFEPFVDIIRIEQRLLNPETPPILHPDLCILNHWIYCSLFHHNITAAYRPVHVPALLTAGIRMDYLRYCVPDKFCRNVDYSVEFPGHLAHKEPGMASQLTELEQLLTETSYREDRLKTMLGYEEEYISALRSSTSQEDLVTDTIMHHGLLTMRVILAARRPRAQGFERPDVTLEVDIQAVRVDVTHAHGKIISEVGPNFEESTLWGSLRADIDYLI